MPTTVEPTEFAFVKFDAAHIAALVDQLAANIGLDADITIEIDESSALAKTEVLSIDPVHIRSESGAFESQKALREFSDELAIDVLGRHLLRISDRRSDAMKDVPGDRDLSLAERAAWDAYTVGRLARAGYPVQRQRWLYTFRNRHGFTDAADAAFEHLWNGDSLTWAEISSLSAETAAANPGPLER